MNDLPFKEEGFQYTMEDRFVHLFDPPAVELEHVEEFKNLSTFYLGIVYVMYEEEYNELHVWLRRPGLLIGKAGSTINKVEEMLDVKVKIHEVKSLKEFPSVFYKARNLQSDTFHEKLKEGIE